MSDLQDLIHKTSIDCIEKGQRMERERIIKLLEEWLHDDNGDFVGLTAANNGAAFADAIEIILDEIKEDPTLSDRCRLQAERFPWSETIHKLNTLHPVSAA